MTPKDLRSAIQQHPNRGPLSVECVLAFCTVEKVTEEPALTACIQRIRTLWDRYQNWQDVIASYDAGHPVRVGTHYVNQGFVDKVLSWWGAYEEAIPLKESEA